MDCKEKLDGFFTSSSKRMVFLGHALAAAPHPIVMWVGLFIAGLGWFSSKAKFNHITGSMLVASSLLPSTIMVYSWFVDLGWTDLNLLNNRLNVFLPLSVTVFVVNIVAYGFLVASLTNLSTICRMKTLKCATMTFLILILMSFLAVSTLAYALVQNLSVDSSTLRILITLLEGSVFSIISLNFLGNILVSIGFARRRAKLISSHHEKNQLGDAAMKVKIKWFGHAAFMLTFKGKRVIIDPWVSNPLNPVKLEDLERVDYIIVTHDHFDHLGDAESIAKKFNSTIIGVPELVTSLEKEGGRGLSLNMGSFVDVDGVFKVALVPALHTCGVGEPVGVVVDVDGLRVYHMGDTGYTSEFQAIKDVFNPEVVLIPIGGHYTMGPREAALALKVLTPKIAIPMHYATFPVLVKTADDFVKEARAIAPNVKIMVLKPGEEVEVP